MMSSGWSWSGSGVLFDMDGTLVDSGASVVRAWRWAAAELDIPYNRVAPFIHGIPAGQVLSDVAPSVAQVSRDAVVRRMLSMQTTDTSGIVAVPGALAALDVLPTARWAVVTSADQALALARIRAAGLPLPRHLITAELTDLGKPAPDPFLLAAQRLGFAPAQCLVVEDSAAGVTAGVAAGCPVLGLLTSSDALADTSFAVADLSEVEFSADRLGVAVSARR
jgi:sugar-phosphatase